MGKWVTILLTAVGVAFIVLGAWVLGTWQFNRILSEFHLHDFRFHLESVNQHTLRFSDISVSQRTEDKERTLNLQNITITWAWENWFSPQLNSITIEAARVNEVGRQTTSNRTHQPPLPFQFPKSWPDPDGFPKQIQVDYFLVTLLCPTGTCAFSGNLRMHSIKEQNSSSAINLDFNLIPEHTLHAQHPVHVDAFYRSEGITGKFSFAASIPTPITIPQIGTLAGEADFDLEIAVGKLKTLSASGNLKATQLIIPESWRKKGLSAESASVKFHSRSSDALNPETFAIEFSGESQGDIQTSFSGNLNVDSQTKKIGFKKLSMTTKASRLTLTNDIALANTNLNLQLSGFFQPADHAQPAHFKITLLNPSQLSSDLSANIPSEIKKPEPVISVTAKSAQVNISQLDLSGDIIDNSIVLPSVSMSADASLAIANVSYPLVNDGAWKWQGKILGTIDNIMMEGTLVGGKSLTLTHKIKRSGSELNLDWRIPDIFLLAKNPFADILKSWPPLLSLTRGKLNANGSLLFNLDSHTLTKSKTDLNMVELSGIYDTLAFQGLSSQVSITTTGESLRAATDELTIHQVNKGFVIGPILVAGDYESLWATNRIINWDKLTQGKFSLKHFDATAMNGHITTAAQVFDFSKDVQRVLLQLKDIDLAMLLQQHSAGDLSGSGLLSGNMPVDIKGTHIRIVEGLVSAQLPGGYLKYSSERARALAQAQPSMKLVTDALSNFHYSLLSSKMNYDETGKLRLSVRLEGKNPAIENGRPIHFNVNLEEDVPAMLASIQLSGKVSDIIQKRLQQRIQNKPSTDAKP